MNRHKQVSKKEMLKKAKHLSKRSGEWNNEMEPSVWKKTDTALSVCSELEYSMKARMYIYTYIS